MNTKITLVEIVDLMAEATSTNKRVCELFVRELFATVSQALIDGGDVKIKGVGTFKITPVKARKSVNVTNGDSIEVTAHNKVTFTPDKALAEAVNQPFAQFETVVLDDAVTDKALADIDKQYPSYFPDSGELPDMPDMPLPPIPDASVIPADEPRATANTPKPKAEPKPEPETKAAPEPKPKPEPEPKTKPEPVQEKKKKSKPVAPLMGRPIDGPTEEPKPAPSPTPTATKADPEEEDYFYRPAPRNAYTPTREQLSQQQAHRHGHKRWWLWIALGVIGIGLLAWALIPNGNADNTDAATDSIPMAEVVDEPEVVTDTVTSQIVLSILSEKYYDSPWFWVYIFEENKDIISDPDNVRPGTVVVIPPAEKYGIDAKDPASLKRAQRRSWEILKGKGK